MVQVVEGYLTNNATEAQIISKLEAMCDQLPSPYADQVP